MSYNIFLTFRNDTTINLGPKVGLSSGTQDGREQTCHDGLSCHPLRPWGT